MEVAPFAFLARCEQRRPFRRRVEDALRGGVATTPLSHHCYDHRGASLTDELTHTPTSNGFRVHPRGRFRVPRGERRAVCRDRRYDRTERSATGVTPWRQDTVGAEAPG